MFNILKTRYLKCALTNNNNNTRQTLHSSNIVYSSAFLNKHPHNLLKKSITPAVKVLKQKKIQDNAAANTSVQHPSGNSQRYCNWQHYLTNQVLSTRQTIWQHLGKE